jgi:hypothetical protein
MRAGGVVVKGTVHRTRKDGPPSFVGAEGRVKGVGQECPTYTGDPWVAHGTRRFEMRPLGLEAPELLRTAYAALEGPLFHGGARQSTMLAVVIPPLREGGGKWGTRLRGVPSIPGFSRRLCGC